ncbi:MAG: phage tail tape measure protein, partial [Chloroflexi bacterium]
ENLQSIAETAGQLGIQGRANIKEFTKVVAEMAVATDLSAEQAANGFARLGNVLGEPVTQYERMGSVINELSNNTTALASDIVEISNRMAGMARTFGLSTRDIFGYAAALKDIGLSSEVAGSAFSRMLGSMLQNTEKYAKFMGVTLEELKRDMKEKPAEAINAFLEAMGKLDASEQVAVLKELKLSSVEVTGAVLKLSANMQKVNADLRVARDEWRTNTSLTNEYTTASQSLNAQFQQTKNTLVALAAKIGEALLPVIKDANASFQTWVGSIDSSKVESFGRSIADLVSGLSGLIDTLATINDVLMPDFLSKITGLESTTLFGAVAEGWSDIADAMDPINAAFEDFDGMLQRAEASTASLSARVAEFGGESTAAFGQIVSEVRSQIAANNELIASYSKYTFARDFVSGLREENDRLMSLYGELSQKRPYAAMTDDAKSAAKAVSEVSSAIEKSSKPAKIDVDADTKPAEEKIRSLDKKGGKAVVAVDADTKSADAKIGDLEKPKRTSLHVEPDTAKVKAAIADLKRPTSSVHTVYVRTVQQRAEGGPIGFSSGGRVPGYDPLGSDDVPALLTRGEYVIRADAAKFYGNDLLNAMNMKILPRDVFRFDMPKISLPPVTTGRYSTGGPVDSGVAAREVTVNLKMPDGDSFSLSADERTAELLGEYFRKFA